MAKPVELLAMKALELLAMNVDVPVLEAELALTTLTATLLLTTEVAPFGPDKGTTQSGVKPEMPPEPPTPAPLLETVVGWSTVVTLPPAPVTDAEFVVTAAPPTPAAAEMQAPPLVLQADAAAAPTPTATTVAISSATRQR